MVYDFAVGNDTLRESMDRLGAAEDVDNELKTPGGVWGHPSNARRGLSHEMTDIDET